MSASSTPTAEKKEPTGKDRRRAQRAQADLFVFVKTGGRSHFCQAIDISSTGIRIQPPDAILGTGENVYLDFDVEDVEIETSAEVATVHDDGTLGLRFLALSTGESKMIAGFVEQFGSSKEPVSLEKLSVLEEEKKKKELREKLSKAFPRKREKTITGLPSSSSISKPQVSRNLSPLPRPKRPSSPLVEALRKTPVPSPQAKSPPKVPPKRAPAATLMGLGHQEAEEAPPLPPRVPAATPPAPPLAPPVPPVPQKKKPAATLLGLGQAHELDDVDFDAALPPRKKKRQPTQMLFSLKALTPDDDEGTTPEHEVEASELPPAEPPAAEPPPEKPSSAPAMTLMGLPNAGQPNPEPDSEEAEATTSPDAEDASDAAEQEDVDAAEIEEEKLEAAPVSSEEAPREEEETPDVVAEESEEASPPLEDDVAPPLEVAATALDASDLPPKADSNLFLVKRSLRREEPVERKEPKFNPEQLNDLFRLPSPAESRPLKSGWTAQAHDPVKTAAIIVAVLALATVAYLLTRPPKTVPGPPVEQASSSAQPEVKTGGSLPLDKLVGHASDLVVLSARVAEAEARAEAAAANAQPPAPLSITVSSQSLEDTQIQLGGATVCEAIPCTLTLEPGGEEPPALQLESQDHIKKLARAEKRKKRKKKSSSKTKKKKEEKKKSSDPFSISTD